MRRSWHAVWLRLTDDCYLHGFFLEGVTWDDENGIIKESEPKVIHVPLPVMHFFSKYLVPNATKSKKGTYY